MLTRLYFLIGWLTATVSLAQGTFTYTFSGDNSPLNVWATFTVSPDAVATGTLTTANVISGYMLQDTRQGSIFYLNVPVNPANGHPNGPAINTKVAASISYDELDIYGGLQSDPDTMIVYYPWIGSPSSYSRTLGKWSVTFNVPEPNTASLLVIGLALLRLTKRLRSAT